MQVSYEGKTFCDVVRINVIPIIRQKFQILFTVTKGQKYFSYPVQIFKIKALQACMIPRHANLFQYK